jgi:ribosomal protein S27E
VKVNCPDCGKKYLLKGRPKGESIECPRCSATIPLPEEAAAGRSALREELSRLASGQDEDSPRPRKAPRMQVTNPEDEQVFAGRGRVFMLIAGVLLLLLLLGGGATYLVMRLDPAVTVEGNGLVVVTNTPDEDPESGNETAGDGDAAPADTPVATTGDEAQLPAAVRRALFLARRPVTLCNEEQALERWRAALRLLEQHEDVAAGQIREAEQKIAELSETVQERREVVDELQSKLERARASAEGGRTPAALRQVEELLEQTDRLQCSGPAAREVREGSLALKQRLTGEGGEEDDGAVAIKPPKIVDDPDHILDKPAPGTEGRWSAEGWSNDVDISLEGQAPHLYRRLEHKRGSKGKWVVTMNRPIDLTEHKALMLDMRVQEQVSVALGVWVGNALYESRPVTLRKTDKWQLVEFDLKSDDFKCDRTNWNFGARLADPKAVTRFSLFFYSQARSPILFANVRLHKGD